MVGCQALPSTEVAGHWWVELSPRAGASSLIVGSQSCCSWLLGSGGPEAGAGPLVHQTGAHGVLQMVSLHCCTPELVGCSLPTCGQDWVLVWLTVVA